MKVSTISSVVMELVAPRGRFPRTLLRLRMAALMNLPLSAVSKIGTGAEGLMGNVRA